MIVVFIFCFKFVTNSIVLHTDFWRQLIIYLFSQILQRGGRELSDISELFEGNMWRAVTMLLLLLFVANRVRPVGSSLITIHFTSH